jgi:hypothetical protein
VKWSSINYLKIDFLKNPALILFCLASLIYILAGVYERELFVLISKSLVVPSILLYYIQSCKKIELHVLVLYGFFFTGDIIMITNPENSLSWIIVIYIIGYLLIFYSVITELKKEKDTKISKNKIYNIIVLMFTYLFIYFQFIDFIFDFNFEYKPLYLLASIILLLLSITITISCVLQMSIKKWLLILAILMIVISNFVFVCHIYYVEVDSLYFWSLITQSFFYFFLINYYLINNKKEATPNE